MNPFDNKTSDLTQRSVNAVNYPTTAAAPTVDTTTGEPDISQYKDVSSLYPETTVTAPKDVTLGELPGQILQNAPSSAWNVGTGIVSGLANMFNPDVNKNTLVNVGKLASGAVQAGAKGISNLTGIPTGINPANDNTATFGAFTGMLGQRYGSPQAILNTTARDPFGVLLDALTIADGVGAIGKASGLLGDLNKAAETGKIAKIAEMTTSPTARTEYGLFNRGNLAKGIIQPAVQMGAEPGMFDVPRAQNVAQNILDVTKGITHGAQESSIRDLYNKVNSQLDTTLKSIKTPIPVKDIVSDVGNAVMNNSLVNKDWGVFKKVFDEVGKYIKPDEAGNVLVNSLHEATKAINAELNKVSFGRRGFEGVTSSPYYSALNDAKNVIYQKMGTVAPNAQELINAQSQLLSAHEGMIGTIKEPSFRVRGPVSLEFRGLETIMDPIKTILARNPNSPVAMRLRELVPAINAPGISPLVQARAITDFFKNLSESQNQQQQTQ